MQRGPDGKKPVDAAQVQRVTCCQRTRLHGHGIFAQVVLLVAGMDYVVCMEKYVVLAR
jgi:hypothetical protein